MNIHRFSALAVAVAALVVSGCDKKAADSEASATGCAAGATRSTEGGFCLTVPAGLKASPPYDKNTSSRRYDYADGTGKSIAVVVTQMKSAAEWDSEVSLRTREANAPNHRQPEVKDLPGGGKFISWVDDNGPWATVITHKDLKLFFCRVGGKATDAMLVDACKSLRPL